MKFKKIILFHFLYAAFCLLSTKGQAQEDLSSLGVLQFEPKGVSEMQAQRVTRSVETALYQTNRFNIVTRDLLEVIEFERETQKEDVDHVVIEQGKAIGADYIIKGVVSQYKKGISQVTNKEGVPINKVYTSTQVEYTIKVIEVKTGIIMAGDTYKGSFNGIDHHIRNFIRSEFPYSFTILEILKKKRDKKVKHVLLDGGFKQGLKPGVHLEVFESTEENVEGYILKREVKVGDLYLKELGASGNFSVCQLYKAEKSILQKIESGANLICKIPKSFRLFGMKFEYEY